MTGKTLDPRIAALWLVHGRACASLLRAKGSRQHAENYEAALDELMEILAEEVGRARLASAIDWVSDCIWAHDVSTSAVPVKN